MKVYLDTCSIQRPLDSRNQIRIALESEAVIAIIAMCEAGHLDLVSSEALLFESERNTDSTRKEFALAILQTAKQIVRADDEVVKRAKELNDNGLMALDALHLASAEKAGADFFCTCDDKLLKKAVVLAEAGVRVVSPIELIGEIGEIEK